MTTKKQILPWQSILAGGAAGGLESMITLFKGSAQRPSPIKILTSTMSEYGIRAIYTGSGAFCISNALKSAIRFFTFDSVRKFMPVDASGKTTSLGNMCAGLMAGMAEAVAVVTPGETIKTKMIDDRAGPRLYRSTGHGIVSIVAREGLSGIYRGAIPVTLKQSANAMVRFTSYNLLLSQMEKVSSQKSVHTVMAGAMAGVVTVYATMPFDSIKTKLQAVDGHQMYRGSLDCLRSVISQEGVSALWRGTTPRLVRLSVCFPLAPLNRDARLT
ncbi:unnamed protein product [Penicillium palitans]